MPKVEKVKAGKDYPQFGIKKGEEHYVWSMKMQRGGVTKRSKVYPRQSQLTQSEYKIQAHQLNERLEDMVPTDMADLRDQIQSLIDDATELKDETESRKEQMPEGLQEGPTGELMQNRIDALETFIDELEAIDYDDFAPDPEAVGYDAEENIINSEGQTEDEYLEDKVAAFKEISLEVD